MRNFNKVYALLLSAAVSLSPLSAFAQDFDAETNLSAHIEQINSAAEETKLAWTASEKNGTAEIENSNFTLTCETSRATSANVTVTSGAIDGISDSKSILDITFKLNTSGLLSDDVSMGAEGMINSKIGLTDSGKHEAPFLTISGEKLFFGDDTENFYTLTDSDTSVRIIADFMSNTARIYANDEEKYSGEINGLQALDEESAGFVFSNYFGRAWTKTVLKISGFEFSQKARLAFDGAYVGDERLASDKAYSKEDFLNGIQLRFSGEITDDIYDISNYDLYMGGSSILSDTVRLKIEKKDYGVLVDLSDISLQAGEYELKIAKIIDSYTQEEADAKHSYTFSVIPEGYEKPQIEIDVPQNTKYLGEEITMNFKASGSWEKTEVYIDEALYGTYERESFKINFKADRAKEYTVRADVFDIYGKAAQQEVTIVFNKNSAPAVSFVGCDNGGTLMYSVNDEKNITVNAVDSDGSVGRIEIYADGKLKKTETSDTVSFDFDELDCGLGSFKLKAAAYDEYGLSGEAEITVTVNNELKNLLYEESEFMQSKISTSVQRGFARFEETDEEHGRSLVMGMDETSLDPKADYSMANFSVTEGTKTEIVFDICPMVRPTMSSGINFAMRSKDAKIVTLFAMTKSGFKAGNKVMDFNVGEWYTVSVTVNVDGENSYYSVSVNGKELCPVTKQALGEYSNWRLHTGINLDERYKAAFDNFKVYNVVSAPSIVSVGYDDTENAEEIPYNAKAVTLKLSGALVREDINVQNVFVLSGGRKLNIKSIAYNSASNTVSIQLDGGFKPDTEYTVEMSGNIRISGDVQLGDKLSKSFKTTKMGMDIGAVSWGIKRGNISVSFTPTSLTGKTEKVYAVLSLWNKDGSFGGTYAESFTAVSGMPAVCSMEAPYNDGMTAEVYFMNGLEKPVIYDTSAFSE